MAEIEHPQIYLITPPVIELSTFPDLLASVLDANEVSCIRLALSSQDEIHIARACDALRQVSHERDVALVIEAHVLMVDAHGLDGVHLTDGARSVRAVRKDLGGDAIVGTFSGTSRHDGMNAGEGGADYVSFGPVGASLLGDGNQVDIELFEWWSEIVEVPIVAEGGVTPDVISDLREMTDFFGIGAEIWGQDDPAGALAGLIALMK
jgi:thiamine-phosphate pyrophosphorylase